MKPYYESGGITIYHGDCRDVLPSITMADALVTDPPYGIGWKRASWADDPASYPERMGMLVREARRTVANGWCFVFQAMLNVGRFHEWFPNGWRIYAACKNFAQVRPTGVWHSWDPVVFWANGVPPRNTNAAETVNRDFSVGNVAGVFGDQIGHPCPRPRDTMEHIVSIASLPGQTILDPFAGAGTTLLAAKELGRRAIGVEIEERYCEIAARRLDQEVLDFGGTA